MVDFTALQPTKEVSPPRVLIYGPEKIGKTSLLAEMPKTIFLDIERGSSYVKTIRYPLPLDSYDAFKKAIDSLIEDPHDFENIVIDTADRMQFLIQAQAAVEHGKKSVADVDFQKGYVTAENILKYVLDGLDVLRLTRNVGIFFISHAAIKRYDNPVSGSYDRYNTCLHENTRGGGFGDILKHWVDATLFINYEVFKKSEDVGFKKKLNTAAGGGRYIFSQETPSFVAGNRWKISEPIPYESCASAWSLLNQAITKGMAE